MVKVGDPAPDFKVKNHRGADVQLSKLRGKTVVLYFYPKADTPGCTKEGCGFRDRISDFAKSGATILGASYDTPEDNKKFAEKFSFNFDLISDVDKSIAKAYGAFDPEKPDYARRAAFIIGKDGKITHAWEKVPAAEFPEQALAAVGGKAKTA